MKVKYLLFYFNLDSVPVARGNPFTRKSENSWNTFNESQNTNSTNLQTIPKPNEGNPFARQQQGKNNNLPGGFGWMKNESICPNNPFNSLSSGSNNTFGVRGINENPNNPWSKTQSQNPMEPNKSAFGNTQGQTQSASSASTNQNSSGNNKTEFRQPNQSPFDKKNNYFASSFTENYKQKEDGTLELKNPLSNKKQTAPIKDFPLVLTKNFFANPFNNIIIPEEPKVPIPPPMRYINKTVKYDYEAKKDYLNMNPPKYDMKVNPGFLKCYICCCDLKEPCICPFCHQPSCYPCIEKWLNQSSKCPHCRHSLTKQKVIKLNYIKDVVDYYSDLNVPQNEPPKTKCLKHLTNYSYYCETCKELLCPDCFLSDSVHRKHKIKKIEEVYSHQVDSLKKIKEEMKEKEDILNNKITKGNQKLDQIREMKKDIENSKEKKKFKETVDFKSEEVKNELTEIMEKYQNEVEILEQAKLKMTKEIMNTTKEDMISSKAPILNKTLDKLLKDLKDSHLLEMEVNLDSFKKKESEDESEIEKVPFTITDFEFYEKDKEGNKKEIDVIERPFNFFKKWNISFTQQKESRMIYMKISNSENDLQKGEKYSFKVDLVDPYFNTTVSYEFKEKCCYERTTVKVDLNLKYADLEKMKLINGKEKRLDMIISVKKELPFNKEKELKEFCDALKKTEKSIEEEKKKFEEKSEIEIETQRKAKEEEKKTSLKKLFS
ncbi:MAG: hypothetical protein MJ252_20215 [archaeon]|nr:hypothetical protein [archaeon]